MSDIKVPLLTSGLKGEIIIPPDKSLSHRAVMLLSLASGSSVIKNFSLAADPKSTLDLFRHLGVVGEFINDNSLKITSTGRLQAPKTDLYCGNSGTTMRLAAGILCAQGFNSVLTGDSSLSMRPMKRITEPLSLMGANITSTDGHAPLKISGCELKPIRYKSNISSAQVKSAILLAGIQTNGETVFEEPYQSRNHTELMLKYLGADIKTDNNKTIVNKSEIQSKTIEIAGDISSAAFFIAAALIVPNSNIILKNVGLNPTRTGIIDILNKMGADIEILDLREISGEKVGDLRVRYSELRGTEIGGEVIPRLIDEIPVIAVVASQAKGKTIIKDASDLRNKESDRISVLCTEFQKIGVDVKENQDGFEIVGAKPIIGGCELNPQKDHRLALSFYIAGLVAKKEILIKDFDCINISLPEFLKLISKLY